MESKIYTVKQFAERWHVNRSTLYAWMARGILVPIKRGRRTYFMDSSFVEGKEAAHD